MSRAVVSPPSSVWINSVSPRLRTRAGWAWT